MSYGKKIEQKKPPKSVQRSGGGGVFTNVQIGGVGKCKSFVLYSISIYSTVYKLCLC
jgi:hypothetical protein